MIDIGWIIGNVSGGLFILVALIFTIWAFVHNFDSYDILPKLACVISGFAALLVLIGINLWWNFPFNMEYHSYKPVSGTVSNVASRQVDTGNHASETKYVFTFKGSQQQYGCTDTRCALMKPGNHLQLLCERHWQYASVSGYNCNYDQ